MKEPADSALTTERELIDAASAGNKDAFALLYERNVDSVYRYVLSRVGDPADAEDITAEVFIRAMRSLPSYRHQGVPFVAWLIRIAHNLSVNHFKKQARRREAPLETHGTHAQAAEGAEDYAVRRAEQGEIAQAMGELTDLQRQVLNLRFIAGLSVEETAKAMDRSREAVRFLQFSALKALRRVYDRREVRSSNER